MRLERCNDKGNDPEIGRREGANVSRIDGNAPFRRPSRSRVVAVAVLATLFWARITADGEMRDVRLYKSSGDDELDQAILRCADGAYYSPVRIGGIPTEITWVIGYFWWLQSSSFHSANPAGGIAGSCPVRRYYPAVAIRRHLEGKTTVSYRIATDGTTKDAKITESSGTSILDQASLDCVGAYKYAPALHNGRPVEVDGVVSIVWKLR
jgi:TonB family protein